MGKKELTKKQLKKSLKSITEGSIQMKDHLKTAYNAIKKLDKISVGQKIKNNKGDNVTVTPKDNDKILAAMRKVEDIYRDIIGGEIKDKEEKDEKEKATKTSKANEQSEGHGSMPSEVIKMTESTLRRVVKRVIQEQGKKVSPVSRLIYDAQQMAKWADTAGAVVFDESLLQDGEFNKLVVRIKDAINDVKL